MDRGEVRELVARAMLGATIADARVYTPLDWDTWDGEYPVVMVRAPSEDKESLGRGAPQFTVTATIQIVARIEVLADTADTGALIAERLMEAFERQILRSVINFPDLMAVLQQHPFVRTKIGYSPEGEQHLAELVIELGCEFYQGPEDFYPVPEVPLRDVRLNDPAVFEGLAPPELEADVPIAQT